MRGLTGEGPGRMDRLSAGYGPVPPTQEVFRRQQLRREGDSAGLAATADGVAADWPTTVGVKTSYPDSDIAVCEVHLPS